MPRLNLNQYAFEDDLSHSDRRTRRMMKQKPDHKPKRSPAAQAQEMAAQAERQENFSFTYKASRHERAWIVRSLGGFYEQHWIDDVLRLLKGGKEASVYLCEANASTPAGDRLAAKVYRPRMFRNLKNDHLYREGRSNLDADGNQILDGGMQHAMHKRTAYGQELLHGSWIMHEFQTLQRLHAAGADVPVPYACGDNAILMEYIGDRWMPAPTLNTVELDPDEAPGLFERLLHNIDLMLSQERIHGDLSAYNVLYWEGEIRLIDFPQAIHPDENRSAYLIFERDVTRICAYFARQGVDADPRRIAADLWTSYGRSLKPEVHPRLLEDEKT
jgi:RIO kinase 1